MEFRVGIELIKGFSLGLVRADKGEWMIFLGFIGIAIEVGD